MNISGTPPPNTKGNNMVEVVFTDLESKLNKTQFNLEVLNNPPTIDGNLLED